MNTLFRRRWFVVLVWILATVTTVLLGGYQRRTGPSYPKRVQHEGAGLVIGGELVRSHGGEGGAVVEIDVEGDVSAAELHWRPYPTDNEWEIIHFHGEGEHYTAELPHQPPAGKLEYVLRFASAQGSVMVPSDESVIIRFKGAVPAPVLIAHIFFMFLALIFGMRIAYGLLLGEEAIGHLAARVLILLVPGGLILGPIVQKYAFGAYWTGWPFGEDWTDNKTLASVLAWLLAWFLYRQKSRLMRWGLLLGMLVMLAVYLIPHSIHGSQLDWEEHEAIGAEETPR